MSGLPLTVLTAIDTDGATILRAPKVGLWSDQPGDGALVGAGSAVGTLSQLGRRFRLLVPEGVSGRVKIDGRPQAALPVEYGQPLCRIVLTTAVARTVAAAGPSSSPSMQGTLTMAAPTDGVFYRAAALGARPFVAVGERIATGRSVGLIEVMKTFNPIAYGGPGWPDEAEVVEIVAADGQEVRAGQALVVVKKP